ncbi:MAG: cyclic nucleotide-binding domain-containing protein [Devosia sp.]
MDSHWFEMVGYGGTAMTIASYSMRTIIPLRIAGIASSVFFIAYGAIISSWPVLMMEMIILPLNVVRLTQLLRLMRDVNEAKGEEFDPAWLSHFVHGRAVATGEILFRRGEVANQLFLIQSGRFRVVEYEKDIGAGELTGELAFLTPGNLRTGTLECVEAGQVGWVSYSEIKQIFFQNPKFGFYLMKLITTRLLENQARADAANERTPLAAAAE